MLSPPLPTTAAVPTELLLSSSIWVVPALDPTPCFHYPRPILAPMQPNWSWAEVTLELSLPLNGRDSSSGEEEKGREGEAHASEQGREGRESFYMLKNSPAISPAIWSALPGTGERGESLGTGVQPPLQHITAPTAHPRPLQNPASSSVYSYMTSTYHF